MATCAEKEEEGRIANERGKYVMEVFGDIIFVIQEIIHRSVLMIIFRSLGFHGCMRILEFQTRKVGQLQASAT